MERCVIKREGSEVGQDVWINDDGGSAFGSRRAFIDLVDAAPLVDK
jgi:hypothetical protein